jgi:drug/metabolite transporter (DMT)-like permease
MTHQLKGTNYITISAFFFASYGIWSRLMHDTFSPFNQAWSRGLFLLIISLIIGFITHQFSRIQRKDIPWFLLIALCGGLNQAPYYFGFEYLPIGTATLFFYVSLVVGGYIIAKLVMKENITPLKLISLILAIIGMGILYRFSLTPQQIVPATFTILAGLMGAVAAVLPKKITTTYSELQILTLILASMFLFNFTFARVLDQPLPHLELSIPWLAWLGYAIALLIANLTVIAGFKYLDATIGSILGTLEIIFAIIFGIVLFGETLTPSTIIGSLIILTAILFPYLKPLKLMRKDL